MVGDPEIADVMPLTDQTLYVLGKKIGTTNVSVYDAGSNSSESIEVEVAYNTPRLAADLERHGPGRARACLLSQWPHRAVRPDGDGVSRRRSGDLASHMARTS